MVLWLLINISTFISNYKSHCIVHDLDDFLIATQGSPPPSQMEHPQLYHPSSDIPPLSHPSLTSSHHKCRLASDSPLLLSPHQEQLEMSPPLLWTPSASVSARKCGLCIGEHSGNSLCGKSSHNHQFHS